MTVVVTGASGHIGGNLIDALSKQGRKIRAVVRQSKDPEADKANRGLLDRYDVEYAYADVRDLDSVRAAFDGAEVVYHLAALISIDGDQGGLVPAINVDGANNVAQAAHEAGVKRLIHFCSVHAFNQSPLDQELDENRERALASHHNAYDRSKAQGEIKIREWIAKGLDAVILHPTGVLGPLDPAPSRMGQVFLDLYHGTMPGLIDGGFNWVDARDVVQGALLAEEKGRSGESYLLGGSWHSIKELAQIAESLTGRKAPGFVSPMWLARFGAPFQTAFNRMLGKEPLYTSESLEALRANRTISSKKAETELGYTSRDINETVRDVYSWFELEGRLAKMAS